MAMKGLFFSLDALFAVIIALIILTVISFHLLRGQEDIFSRLYLFKIANDALVVLDKNKTLSTLDNITIINGLNSILPKNLAYKFSVKVYECSNVQCTGFNEATGKSFNIIPNVNEENPSIAKRSFLTFENKRIKYFSNAELRVWLK